MVARQRWGGHACAALALLGLASCGRRETVPPFVATDARFGRLAGSEEAPSRQAMCKRWTSAVVVRDEWAITHVSFPESDVQASCFTPVVHAGRNVTTPPPPRGCSYP